MKHFYAYHGPGNNEDFDFSGGYGVSQEYKQKQTKIGDLVYIIQKREHQEFYELCGAFEILDHYYEENNKRPYRVKLENKSNLDARIVIDEQECSRRLPQIDGNAGWSIFQRHFCRQGVSFQRPLRNEVIDVLEKLLDKNPILRDLANIEEDFFNEIAQVSVLSKEERLKILATARKIPRVAKVTTTVFLRNPYVVVEVLERAHGVCESCKIPAPFLRHSDGSPYLEVHHKIRLADGGEDTVENALALCPNCHRKMHFGIKF